MKKIVQSRRLVWSRLVAGACLAGIFLAKTSAQVIPNPSFEVDTFTVFPGYVSGNAPITGWTGNADARVGLNPSGGSPFANNGLIPEGAQVGFIQSDTNVAGGVTLSAMITGLSIGETYKVNFRVNARAGNTPNLKIDIDATRIIDTGVTPVGGTAPYKYFAFDFTAEAESQTLTLRNDAGGDNTVVIDDFSIAPRNSGWSYAAWTDDASSGVDSSRTYTHAYSFGNVTNTTIEGVEFTGVGGGNPSVPGSFSTAGLPNVFNTDANNLGGGSRQLANDFLYGGAVQSITIDGLIPGGEYVATIFSVGWEDGTRAATFGLGEDRLTVNQDHFGNNNGIRVSSQYVAESNSVTLTFVPLQGNTFHVYGFANYVLSTPASPSIGVHPKSQRVSAGEEVAFTVVAAGSDPLLYFWRKDDVELPNENGSTLTLPGVSTANNGFYSVIVSNSIGMVTSAVARLQVGLPMVNRSFEADTFQFWPGYVGPNPNASPNGPITGWTSLDNHGINPVADGRSPFADNGIIPDGQKVAFMQGDGALSQTINGFTVGDTYYVIYNENARNGGVPAVEVKIGDTTIVPAHSRSPVGGGNPYVEVISDLFTATAESLQLSFIKSNPNGGDTTALIDNPTVIRVEPGTAPFIARHPQDQIVQAGEAVALTGAAVGSPPLSYQWQKDGAAIDGATTTSFSIPSASKSDAGEYSLVVSNDAGVVTSLVARVTVFLPIPGLFNTGVDDTGAPLADGATDSHYVLIENAHTPGVMDAIVEDSTVFPIVPPGPWVPNTPTSKWIGPLFNTSAGAVGIYVYRLSFNITDRDPSTVRILGQWSVDNLGVDIRVNGVSTGHPVNPGFTAYQPFALASSNATFVAGENTIDFVVENVQDPGYTGLRVEGLTSDADELPPNTPPMIVTQPQSQTVMEGENVTFSVGAIGSPPLVYQWFFQGFEILDATGPTLELTSVTADLAGEYFVQITGSAGVTNSDTVTLTVGGPPMIHLGISLESGNVPVIRIEGAPGSTVALEFKNGLEPGTEWQTLTNIMLEAGSAVVVDNEAPAAGTRFYRATQ